MVGPPPDQSREGAGEKPTRAVEKNLLKWKFSESSRRKFCDSLLLLKAEVKSFPASEPGGLPGGRGGSPRVLAERVVDAVDEGAERQGRREGRACARLPASLLHS